MLQDDILKMFSVMRNIPSCTIWQCLGYQIPVAQCDQWPCDQVSGTWDPDDIRYHHTSSTPHLLQPWTWRFFPEAINYFDKEMMLRGKILIDAVCYKFICFCQWRIICFCFTGRDNDNDGGLQWTRLPVSRDKITVISNVNVSNVSFSHVHTSTSSNIISSCASYNNAILSQFLLNILGILDYNVSDNLNGPIMPLFNRSIIPIIRDMDCNFLRGMMQQPSNVMKHSQHNFCKNPPIVLSGWSL